MAMSQFSFGALESYRKRDEQLPVPGGFNREGQITRVASEIEATGHVLPIGYWKGSGLSLMLDAVATLLSAGNPTCRIPTEVVKETGLSQVFIALAVPERDRDEVLTEIIEFLQSAPAAGSRVRYPGERTLEIRKQNLAEGIPVDPDVWEVIKRMSDGFSQCL